LRLDLAQYRELAAISQFASDLDAATRRQLDRGRRLMEVIKQGVRVPLPVVKQVVIIYAGVNGFLDDIAVNQVRNFESQLNDALDSTYADFVKQFNIVKDMTPDIKDQLEKLLTDFKRSFKPQ
jgi:F-type H+-transporting ATPase subunit alpha